MTEPPRPPGDYGMPPEPNQGGYTPPPGGYQPPPGGYQPSQGGYQPPPGGYPAGPGGAPPGYANSDEKTWALIAHFGGALTGFVAPLVAFLVKGNQSPTIRAHALAALNFQIVLTGAIVASWIVQVCIAIVGIPFVGILLSLLIFAAWIGQVVFGIIAGLKANEGQLYKYPIPVTLVK